MDYSFFKKLKCNNSMTNNKRWLPIMLSAVIAMSGLPVTGAPLNTFAQNVSTVGATDSSTDTDTSPSISINLDSLDEGFTSVLYNNMNGLPTSEANAIATTSEGFIWIGCYSGLVRYDGANFELLDYTNGITSVTELFVDSTDRLWIGTNDSGAAYMTNGKFTHFTKRDGLASLSIRSIIEADNGLIYLGTTNGVAYIDSNNNVKTIDNKRLNMSYVRELKLGCDGVIYGVTQDSSVFTIKDNAVTGFYTSDKLGVDSSRAILPDPDHAGYIYIADGDTYITYGKLNDDGLFSAIRGVGLVSEVCTPEKVTQMGTGQIAVGHVRYATTGADQQRNIQPLVINHRKGLMALSHNGNLTNAGELRDALEEQGAIFHTTTDSEVIAYVIVQERLRLGRIEDAVASAMNRLEGAYSLVISSPTKLIAARDPHGFRPLCMGKTSDGKIVFASETCALDAVGAAFVRDIEPGEVVTVSGGKVHSDRSRTRTVPKRLCVFEYIYFSRPDSVVDGQSVAIARQQAGAYLAQEHPVHADLVIGVPDSGLDAAIGYSRESGIPYAIGFTKNKYIGRTFIAPKQEMREAGVNLKLNPIRSVVEGKRIVLIDDSIVRGTTCRRTIEMLRQAGAREIHMRVSAPPFVAPCYYGTDIDTSENLIANHHSVEEIAEIIGVTSLGYLSLPHTEALGEACGGVCMACFDGCYPTAVPKAGAKRRFEEKIHRKKEG